MLGQEDKIKITGVQAIDRNGKLLDFNLKFPFEEDVEIPEDIVSITIFEYQEGIQSFGKGVFKICIGPTTSAMEICKNNDTNINFICGSFEKIKSVDDKLCYFIDENGKKIIFARVDSTDVVVNNIEEFKNVLFEISDNVRNINNSISRIRRLHLRKK